MQPSAPLSQASPASFTRSKASVLLDLIRGVAALIVMIEHARNLLFVDYKDIPAHRSWFAIPYLLTRAGHQSVMIFFVLSGYLIGGSVFRSLRTKQWSWTGYLTHRLARLWVVVLPGLLACLMLDWIGMHFGHAPALYAGRLNRMVPDVHLSTNAATFFGNFFFLQTIVVPVLGSNSALWSLCYEFWYYMLFPLIWLCLAQRGTKIPFRILYAAFIVAIGFLLPLGISAHFPIWLFGAILALLPIPRFSARARVVAAIVYVPLAFVEPWLTLYPVLYHYPDYILGLLTMAFLWIMLSATATAENSGFSRFSRGLSRFSFTLYVVHLPLLCMLTALAVGERRWQPTLGHTIAGMGICALVMLCAWSLASVTEFRTDSVRKWVERRLHLVRQPASTPHERALRNS